MFFFLYILEFCKVLNRFLSHVFRVANACAHNLAMTAFWFSDYSVCASLTLSLLES